MSGLKDLSGRQFGNLTVIKRAGSSRAGGSTWVCTCSCGEEKVYSSDHLTRKKCPVKSCGCLARRRGKDHPYWNGFEGISGNWWYSHILRERKQTARKQVPVEITMEYAWALFINQDMKCALSGVNLEIANTGKYNTASIDRIDSSKGYEEGNVQWVHKDVNFMKRSYSQEYFIDICRKIAANFEIIQSKENTKCKLEKN